MHELRQFDAIGRSFVRASVPRRNQSGGSVMRIVCFGDSVTRGISFVEGRLRILKDNYPTLLQKTLSPVGVEVLNKGVFNDNSDLLVMRLKPDVLAEHPDYVLIEIGGNDCNFRWGEVAEHPEYEAHQPIVPLDRYLENIRRMVTELRLSGAIPILMNLLPLDPVRYYKQIASTYGKSIAHWIACCGGIKDWHGMYNRSLRGLISALNVVTIDVRQAFKRTADLAVLLSDDGIHPTAEGYRVLSDAVSDVLLPLLLAER